MNKKLLLPLIGIFFAIGIKNAEAQCSFTVRENVSQLSVNHITNLATCATYTVTYTIINNTGSDIPCPFSDTIHLPDSVYSAGPITTYSSSDGASLTGDFSTNNYIPVITINSTTTVGDKWNIGDSITFTFEIVTPCCLPTTSTQTTLMRLSNSCIATPPNPLTLIAPQFFVKSNYPGIRTAYENIGSVVDLVFEVTNNTPSHLPINQYVNIKCDTAKYMKMLGYFFSTTQKKSLDTNNTYCNFDTVAGFFRPHQDTLIQATSLTYFNLFGTNYLPTDSTFYIHILYQVKKCTPAGADSLKFILFCASGGSNPTCYPGQPVTAYINVVTGAPLLKLALTQPVYFDSAHANYCNGGVPSVTLGFIVTNAGTEQIPGAQGNAYADSIKLIFQTARELGEIDTTSFRINGVLISDTLLKLIEKNTTVEQYEVDLNRLHYYCALPFGPNSLADINGRGSLDELSDIPGKNTFTVTVNYEYNPYPTSCPISFSNCGGTFDYPLYLAPKYQNQCGEQMTNGNGGGYVYEAMTGGGAQLNTLSGHDIVEPTSPPFYLQICPGSFTQEWIDSGYHFICPKADDRIIMNLPPEYQVDFSDATVFNSFNHYFANPVMITSPCGCPVDSIYPHVYQLTSTVTCDTNEAIIDFGNIKQCPCAYELHQTYNLSCFKIPLTLVCNGCSNASRGWDNVSYSLAYYCDTSTCSSCGSTISCANTTVFHHCSGKCNAGNDFESHAPFTFRRQTLGWVDTIPSNYYSYLNPPKLNVDSVALVDPWIRLDRAYPGDEILASDSARLDTSLSIFDSVIFQMCYTTSAWAPGSFSSSSIFDFDQSTSYVVVRDTNLHYRVLRFPTLQRSHDRILLDGNVQMSFTFKADSLVDTLLKGLSPPYYLIPHIFLIAKVSPQSVPYNHGINYYNFYAPGQYPLTHLQAQWRGNYAVNPLDTDNSCDPWTADFTILEPAISIIFGGGSSTCAQFTESLSVLQIPACNPYEDFPYEFRPFATLDSNFVLVAPHSCTYDSSQIIAWQDKYDALYHNKFDTNDQVQTNYYHEPASWVGPDTIKYNVHDSNCIPFIDCRNYLSASGVTAYLQASCNTPDDSIYAFTGLTTSIQQLNPAYRVHKNYNFRSKSIHTNPKLQISLPSSAYLCSDSVTFTITLSNIDNSIVAPYPWIALEQSNHLAPPVIFTTVTNALYSDTYNGSDKFIMLNPLNPLTGKTITVTAVVDTSHGWGCVGYNTIYPITILSGNDCTDFTDSMHFPDPRLGCFDTIAIYDFDLFPSSLSLAKHDSTQVDTNSCFSKIKFDFDWNNSDKNTLTVPDFRTYLPIGINLDSAVFVYDSVHYKFTKDDNNNISGNLIWNLTNDAIMPNGFPGSCLSSLTSAFVSIYTQTTCSFRSINDTFRFSSSGVSPCGKTILSDSIIDMPIIPSGSCPTVSIISKNILCYGQINDTAIAVVTGGRAPYTYLWNPSGNTNDTVTGLSVGTYTVTVLDHKGCTATASVTITQPKALSLSMKVDMGCYGSSNGRATVTATGGTPPYTYLWNPSGQTNATVTGLSIGTYTVTVTDSNGCFTNDTITITQPPLLTATVQNLTLICDTSGAIAAVASGGTPTYTYLWSNGKTTDTIAGLSAGIYSVIVMDADSCTATTTDTVRVAPPFTVKILADTSLCFGDSAYAIARVSHGIAPYVYLWSNGATSSSLFLSAGSYTVTVTDSTNCTATAQVNIIVNALPIISGSFYACNDTMTYYINNPAPGASYSWTTIGGSIISVSSSSDTATAAFTSSGGSMIVTETIVFPDGSFCTMSDTLKIRACCSVDGPFDVILSNATASHIHAASLYYCNKHILIEGTFTSDDSVYFQNCDIEFTPYAWINVINNSYLNITNGCDPLGYCEHLHAACDTMWRGIFINAGSKLDMSGDGVLVEDADSAVVAENTMTQQATYIIAYDYFNKNYKDIVIEPYFGTYTGAAYNNIFTCRNLAGYHTCGDTNWRAYLRTTMLYPHIGQRTFMGMDLNGVGHISVIASFVTGYGNMWDNMEWGIHALFSNMQIGSQRFEFIGNIASRGAAIWSQSSATGGGYSLIVGGSAIVDTNYFLHCYRGVIGYQHISTFDVNANLFDYIQDRAIGDFFAILPPSTSNIEHNKIKNAALGINEAMNVNMNGFIYSNNITGICGSIGIRVQEASSNAYYDVQDDTIEASRGIVVNGLKFAHVFENNITLHNCFFPTHQYGIVSTNNQKTFITCNTIRAKDTDDIATGIYSNIAMQCQVISNWDTNVSIGLSIWNSSGGMSVLGNGFYNPSGRLATGIYFNSVTLFPNQGTPALPENNGWFGTFQCNTNLVATFPPIFYWNGLPLNYDPTVGTGPCNPVSILGASCTTCPTNCGVAPPPVVLRRAPLDSIAAGQLPPTQTPDTTIRVAQEGLGDVIMQNPALLSDTLLRQFNDSLQLIPLGTLMQVDTLLNSSSSWDNSTMAIINGAAPTYNIDSNRQLASQSYLSYLMNDSLSASQVTALRILAQKCPLWDGKAVFEARTLLELYDSAETVYSDTNCTCDSAHHHYNDHRHTKPKKNDSIAQATNAQFNLYPNPNNGGFTLSYQLQNGETGEFVIYNTIGQKMADYNLDARSDKMNIDESVLDNGVYFYNIFVNNKIVRRDKLIIIK